MSQNNSSVEILSEQFGKRNKTEWDLAECDRVAAFKPKHHHYYGGTAGATPEYANDWATTVPALIAKLSSDIAEKQKLELRFGLLEILVKGLQTRVQKLENAKTVIVPINTFAPEPYEISKPIFVSVYCAGDEFEAAWFDANIHTCGDNEEEAVSNLKNLILDYFDSFSKEPAGKLGIEPKRQFAIIKKFIEKKL